MDKLFFFFLTRLLTAIASASLFSFLVQIAVFRYTRSEEAPIPVQEIIGFPIDGFELVVAVIWLFSFSLVGLLLFLVRTGKWEVSNISSLVSRLRSLVLFALVSPFVVALAFITFPSLTAVILQGLGHGGRLNVCFQTNNQLEDYNDSIKNRTQTDMNIPYLSNNIRGDLIFLSGDNAYIQFKLRNDPSTIAAKEVGSVSIPGNVVVLRNDYMSAGYHRISSSLVSGDC